MRFSGVSHGSVIKRSAFTNFSNHDITKSKTILKGVSFPIGCAQLTGTKNLRTSASAYAILA